MFQRIIHEQWAQIVPMISFVLTAGVFLAVSIRALFLTKESREHLSRLPFEDSEGK